jgi:diguanylate cyclase (GGDEF)-like protein/PAS domain S-box-containing protein
MPDVAPALVNGLEPAAFAVIALVCLSGAAAAVLYLGRLTDPQGGPNRMSAVVMAACSGAATIWTAHVVSVLSIEPATFVNYDLRMATVALVVALVTAAVAMSLYGPSDGSSALAGAALGAGAAAVHYVGVAALRGPERFVLDPAELMIGVAVAVVASAVAFWIAAKIEKRAGFALAMSLLAAGVVGFHVLAADALTLAPNPRPGATTLILERHMLAGLAAILFGLTLFASAASPLARVMALRGKAATRERAFADLTREGIVICEEARIVDVNLAAARFVGLDPSVMRGRALRDFLDTPDPDRILSASLAKPQEVAVKAMGGEETWVEISSRDVAIDGRQRRVFTLRDLSEHRRKEHQIRHLAYHDPLTGLANRAAFGEALSAALKRGGEVALFCVDLDKFKEVNDVFGHSAGDDILRTAARRLSAAAPDCMAFRLGGDEFVMIGTGPDAGDADKVAHRVTERLNTETVIAGRTIRCGASVGYAVYPTTAATSTRCSPTPTPRSTGRRRTAEASRAASNPRWTSRCASAGRSSRILPPRSAAARCSCTGCRRRTPRQAKSSASRR